MTSSVPRTPLSQFARLDIDPIPVVSNAEFQLVGVYNEGRGLFDRGTMSAAETAYEKMHRLRTGQVVMRRLTAFEGSIAVVPERFDGCVVSPEFPTFTLDTTTLLPGYASLIFQTPAFWKEMERRATGTVQRRKRVSASALLSIPVFVPAAEMQRRVVDLIRSLDHTIKAAREAASAAHEAYTALREEVFEPLPTERLGLLVESLEAGRSFQAEAAPPSDNEFGVLKVSAIQPLFFDARESKAVPPGIRLDPRWEVKAGDLLISRANSPERVAAVCQVDSVRDGLFLCDKTLRIKPKASVSATYLAHAMQTLAVRRQIAALAAGTSASMKNVSQSQILSLAIGAPRDQTEQANIVHLLASQHEAALTYERHAETLWTVRKSIHAEIMAGIHSIPESYDSIMS